MQKSNWKKQSKCPTAKHSTFRTFALGRFFFPKYVYRALFMKAQITGTGFFPSDRTHYDRITQRSTQCSDLILTNQLIA